MSLLTELGIFLGVVFYKYASPTGFGGGLHRGHQRLRRFSYVLH